MEIIREQVAIRIGQETSRDIWDRLSQNFAPLINGIKGQLRNRLGLETLNKSEFYCGDLFFTESGQMLYYLVKGDSSALEIGTLIIQEEGRQIYTNFKEIVNKAIKNENNGEPEWTPVTEPNGQFEIIKKEASILELDQYETEAAFVMKDDRLREMLQTIKEKGVCFQEELMKGSEDYEAVALVDQLDSLGLINREFYVFCRKSGQQISKVDSLSALEEARSHGFKCFSCGRLISEEKISPRIKCSRLGVKFSRSNYWLALHVTYILEDLGFDTENIYYITEKNDKVFDLFTSYFNRFLMIEVKDEPVKLEDAFMFLTRVNYYKPFRAILVSSHLVPIDVRMYLKNFRKCPITLVEGLDTIEAALLNNFREKQEDYLKKIFHNFSSGAEIDIPNLMVEKFYLAPGLMPIKPDTEILTEEEKERLEAETRRRMKEREAFPGAVPEAVRPGEKKLPEKEAPVDITETTEIQGQFTTEIESIVTTEIREAFAEEIPVQFEIEEKVPEVLKESGPEKITEEEKAKEGGISLEFDSSMFPEVLPAEEMPVPGDTSEEELDKLAKFILDFTAGEGIAGNIERIMEEISAVQNVGSYKAVLGGPDGLPITGTFSDPLEEEQIMAYSTAIAESVKRCAGDSGLAPVKAISLEGSTGRIRIFPGDGLYIAAREEKKTDKQVEDSGSFSGETTTREAILKIVLLDLDEIEGVRGNVIAGMDGFIIETLAPENTDFNSLGYMAGLIFSESARYFSYLGIGEIRQILLKTENLNYSLTPIDSEAILITCLDSQAPQEKCYVRIRQAAGTIMSALG